jgi:hypothetical protein
MPEGCRMLGFGRLLSGLLPGETNAAARVHEALGGDIAARDGGCPSKLLAGPSAWRIFGR